MQLDIYLFTQRWSNDGLHMFIHSTRSLGTSLTTPLGANTHILLEHLLLKRLAIPLQIDHPLLHLFEISFNFFCEASRLGRTPCVVPIIMLTHTTTRKQAFRKTANVLSKTYHKPFRSVNILLLMVCSVLFVTLFSSNSKMLQYVIR